MTWDEIHELLCGSTISGFNQEDGAKGYRGASMLSQFTDCLNPDILWFAPLSALQGLPAQKRAGRAFCVYKDARPDAAPLLCAGLVAFGDKESWQGCYNRLLAEFANVENIKDGILDLIALTTRSAGLHLFSNRVAEL
ncbi:MAG: hypothetical protein FWG03_10685, partial [Clostridiales bacterium]|nr:hypothetical protein [Clostridiales bacterium]